MEQGGGLYKTGRRAAARPKANTPLRRQWGLSIRVYVGVYICRLLRLGKPCRAAGVEILRVVEGSRSTVERARLGCRFCYKALTRCARRVL